MNFDRKLLLEDGEEFYGFGFGSREDRVVEVVFNTSMAGYQEILSDPSYTDQAVVMTYPLIGNYGMAKDDYETDEPTLGAFLVREYNDEPSNFRCEKTLGQVMEQYHIPGIWGIDTRKLAGLSGITAAAGASSPERTRPERWACIFCSSRPFPMTRCPGSA